MEPSEQIEMRSMIEDAYPDEDFSLPIFAVPHSSARTDILGKGFSFA